MPSIPLTFDEHGKPFVFVQFISPNIPSSKPLKLCVDTGSTFTTLSPKDAEDMGVDYARLRASPWTHYGFGGRMEARIVEQVCLTMVQDDNTSFSACMDYIHIHMVQSPKKKDKVTYGIPSVLGVDFLKQNGLELVIDWKNMKGWIKKP